MGEAEERGGERVNVAGGQGAGAREGELAEGAGALFYFFVCGGDGGGVGWWGCFDVWLRGGRDAGGKTICV